MNITIICLTQNGLPTAQKIQQSIGGSVYGLTGRVNCENTFDNTTDFIGEQFASGNAVIGICATAILVRSIAPFIGTKKTDSPVISISENGKTIVPILSGHYGGYDIAQQLSMVLDTTPAITTAGDVSLGFSLDNLPKDWKLSDTNLVKPITAELLSTGAVNFIDDIGIDFPNKNAFKGNGKYTVHITNKAGLENDTTLVIYPPSLVLGVGLERHCDGDGLINFIQSQLDKHNYSPKAIACISSIDIKVDEPALKQASKHFAVETKLFTAEQLNEYKDSLANPSEIVFQETGCYGVAEGSVLACGSPLTHEKEKSDKHTVAIGLLDTPHIPTTGR